VVKYLIFADVPVNPITLPWFVWGAWRVGLFFFSSLLLSDFLSSCQFWLEARTPCTWAMN